jgi:NADPH-dependent ferric siderophore reductase
MAEAPARTERPVRRQRLVRVDDVIQVTPHMVRIVFGGESLEGFGAGAYSDHYVKLQVPPAGADYSAPFDQEEIRASRPKELWPRTRTYTVRAWDADKQQLTVDFVVHGSVGVAGPWAAGAQVGDLLQLGGPGGAYTPDPQADWHLMVGDPSVIPAISASLPRIPAGVPVIVLIQVDGPQDEQPLESPGNLTVSWIHSDDEDALADALRALTFPAGTVQAFVHGEAGAVRAVRRHLLAERGLPKEALSVSGYWKRERTEEGWREDKAEWSRLAEADVS